MYNESRVHRVSLTSLQTPRHPPKWGTFITARKTAVAPRSMLDIGHGEETIGHGTWQDNGSLPIPSITRNHRSKTFSAVPEHSSLPIAVPDERSKCDFTGLRARQFGLVLAEVCKRLVNTCYLQSPTGISSTLPEVHLLPSFVLSCPVGRTDRSQPPVLQQ